ncbi:nucleoside hydrolase [Flavimarina sp. Hel_I_48]|uniref:nucleoside hydrolase n=1 Tax=Flavimarina sp. Hel_I_48 TaxID=1392488 RepID=UPI0004DF3621|nr:nucleoside hydrolase [Flavimarina sp. Hel_I_48]
MTKKQVWIDTDLAAGMKRVNAEGFSDVDDAYAILQLMKAENVEIVGMSAVFGNTPLENAFPLCQKMNTEFAGGKIPVHSGAAEALNLHEIKTNDAVEALASALKKQKMIVLAIGPATNIALLLLRYPELKTQIEEVVLVAGRRKETDHFAIGNQGRRAQDLNFDLDNDAFRVLFESGVKVVLCPFEISNKVWLKKADLDQLAQGDAGNKWLAEVSQNWLAQWIHLGADGFNPFDVLASHYISAPEDLVMEELNAHLEIYPDDTVPENDRKAYKNYLLCDKNAGFPVMYCYDVVADYHERLMASF